MSRQSFVARLTPPLCIGCILLLSLPSLAETGDTIRKPEANAPSIRPAPHEEAVDGDSKRHDDAPRFGEKPSSRGDVAGSNPGKRSEPSEKTRDRSEGESQSTDGTSDDETETAPESEDGSESGGGDSSDVAAPDFADSGEKSSDEPDGEQETSNDETSGEANDEREDSSGEKKGGESDRSSSHESKSRVMKRRISVYGIGAFAGRLKINAKAKTTIERSGTEEESKTETSRSSANLGSLETSYGAGVGFMHPSNRFFSIGGRTNVVSFTSEELQEAGSRITVFQTNIVPKGRIPFAGDAGEIYLATPVGLSYYLSSPSFGKASGKVPDIEYTGIVSWNAAAAPGVSYNFLPWLGVFVEGGWYAQSLFLTGTKDRTDVTIRGIFQQVRSVVGVQFLLN